MEKYGPFSRRKPRARSVDRGKRGAGHLRNMPDLALTGMGPLEFAREILDFHPGEHQADILARAPGVKEIKLNCCRQWGKSTLTAVLAVHRLVMEAGATILVVGPAGRQSGEMVTKVGRFLGKMGIRTRGDGVNSGARVLPNGSRIVGLPAVEGTTRGFSAVSMLIVEEAARVPDDVYLALLPSVAVSNGDVILLSTPKGRRGFFYREVAAGDTKDSLVCTGPVTECRHISEEFLAKQKSKGDVYYRQEFLCEFVETGRFLLDEAAVKRMENKDELAWHHL